MSRSRDIEMLGTRAFSDLMAEEITGVAAIKLRCLLAAPELPKRSWSAYGSARSSSTAAYSKGFGWEWEGENDSRYGLGELMRDMEREDGRHEEILEREYRQARELADLWDCKVEEVLDLMDEGWLTIGDTGDVHIFRAPEFNALVDEIREDQ